MKKRLTLLQIGIITKKPKLYCFKNKLTISKEFLKSVWHTGSCTVPPACPGLSIGGLVVGGNVPTGNAVLMGDSSTVKLATVFE